MRGGPNEKHFDLNQFYDAFMEQHGCPPLFAVLYSWIHPCVACAQEIINFFGESEFHSPVWDIETHIGHTTQGTILTPSLTKYLRTAIKKMLEDVSLSLFHIEVGTTLHYYSTLHRFNRGKTG